MAMCKEALCIIFSVAFLPMCAAMKYVETSHSPGSRAPAEHFLTAAHRSHGSPHSAKPNSGMDTPIIALSDLQMQRFGRKHEVPSHVDQPTEMQSVPLRFFQLEQSHENSSTRNDNPDELKGREDESPTLQQTLQDNVTSPDTGFVADSQAALPLQNQENGGVGSDVPPLPFVPDASSSEDEQWKEFAKEEALLASSMEASNAGLQQETGFKQSRSFQLSVVFLGAVAIVLIGGACMVAGFFASFIWQKQLDSPTRTLIEELPVCSASEIEKKLPSSGGYDCIFSKPLSSCELIRLEARVECACEGSSELEAPLSGKPCVLHSVQVSRQLHHGVHPVPIAFTSASVDFVVSLKDAPHVQIEIRGEDVSLFDVGRGQTYGRHAFADAPDTWQDFVLTHRAALGNDWQSLAHVRADSAPLEFQECALLAGTLATFVGELHRGADGKLSLRPLQVDRLSEDLLSAPSQRDWASDLSERWRTSWERSAQPSSPCEEGEKSKTHFAKVLVSDDAQLLTGKDPNSILSAASALIRRFPATCSARALEFANAHCGTKKVFQA